MFNTQSHCKKKALSLRSGKRQIPTLTTFVNIVLEVLAKEIRPEKGIKYI